MTHDFGFGDPRGIRQLFALNHPYNTISFSDTPLSYEYPPHEGYPELIEATKILVRKFIGVSFKHLIITSGATNALCAAISVAKLPESRMVTRDLYFGFYPGIAKIAGLTHTPGVPPKLTDVVVLDSPSNPMGEIGTIGGRVNPLTIWDAAYASPTFGYVAPAFGRKADPIAEQAICMVGSFSKIFGLSGLRVGWIATNDTGFYEDCVEYVTHNLCGVSNHSQNFLINAMKNGAPSENFLYESIRLMDTNRSELERLSFLFGDQPIPKKGMFTLWQGDAKITKLLEKANVKFLDARSVGWSEEHAYRVNMANTNLQTRDMVNAIVKADKIPRKRK